MFHASASQIETCELCWRKWGFRYLDGIKTPSTPAIDFGKEGHKCIEEYFKTGEIHGAEDIVPLVQRAIRKEYLPKASQDFWIEHEFKMPYQNSEDHLLGYIDLLIPGDVPIIIDHKFTKSFRYAKTEETLKTNTQAIVYSAFSFWMFPKADKVVNRWIYYVAEGAKRPRRPSGIRKVELIRYKDETKKQMKPILEIAGDIFKLRRTKKKAMDLTPNLKACGAYGGCPFHSVCQKDSTVRTRFSAIMRQAQFTGGGKEMNLLEKLRARQQESGATGVNPEPEKKTERVEKEAKSEEKVDRLASLRKKAEPQEGEQLEIEAVTETTDTKKTSTTSSKKQRRGKFVLLLNASVSKSNGWGTVVHLSEILKPILQSVAEETGKAHWSLIGYGQGKGLLAVGLDAWLEEQDWRGVLQVDTSSPEAQAVMEVLISNADVVVRGHA